MATPEKGQKVAVIGLGLAGLTTVKNLLEVGFDVTGFERSSYVGGLWHYTEDEKTSVMKNTTANTSKITFCFTDWPYPDDTEDFPTAATVQRYLESYATKFELWPRFRLNTAVGSIARSGDRWELTVSGPQTGQEPGARCVESFDRVVLCMGSNRIPVEPNPVSRFDKFEGAVFNSQTAKRPEDFQDKTVLIVGFGGTACDIANGIVGRAKQVYLSHRRGALVFPRYIHGKPYDCGFLSLRVLAGNASRPPAESAAAFLEKGRAVQDAHFKLPRTWGLDNPPIIAHKSPVFGEEIYQHLHSGAVTLVPALKRCVGGRRVEVGEEEQILEVDAIVFTCGFKGDYSILGEWDPARDTPPEWKKAKGANGRPLPRWYQGVFSLDFPESLANIETIQFSFSSTINSELAAMVIGQVWTGNSKLPSKEDMTAAVAADQKGVIALAQRDDVQPYTRSPWLWGVWADRMAGTGVIDRVVGNGWWSWLFWLWDRRMHDMLLNGVLTPHMWRMFDGGRRKPWKGATEAAIKANQTWK